MRTIKGFFSTFGFINTPAPAVQAYWYIPRLKHGEWTLFLVDTGASQTCLNGIHANSLKKDMLPSTLTIHFGIGGSCKYYNEEATIIFMGNNSQRITRTIKIGIQKIEKRHLKNPYFNVLQCPCLLGRDILQECRLDHNIPGDSVLLEFSDE